MTASPSRPRIPRCRSRSHSDERRAGHRLVRRRFGSEKFYKIDVPAGQEYLTIETSGGTGDVDLYVRKGSKPTLTSWDYRPYLIGNNEKVEVDEPRRRHVVHHAAGLSGHTRIDPEGHVRLQVSATTGNNFASDPDCVAVWRFESGQLTIDSVGTNTLTNHGVTADTTDKKEAAGSANLQAAQSDYFSIANASLSSQFPFTSATAPKTISVAFWMKLNAHARTA